MKDDNIIINFISLDNCFIALSTTFLLKLRKFVTIYIKIYLFALGNVKN